VGAVLTRRGDGGRWATPGVSRVVEAAPDGRPARLVWEQVRLPRLLAGLGVDVHHAPHYTMPRRARLPRVVTVHDLTFFDNPEWHERTKVAVFTRAIRAASVGADAIVCVSRSTADRLDALLSPVAPLHVVPHGVDHARFAPEGAGDDQALLAAFGAQPPYVAFVGTIEPRKDVPTLVRAFDRLAAARPELTLVVAGSRGWGGRAFDAAVAAAAAGDRIVRPGYVPGDAVPALMRGAAAVAYPSLAEGFGLPALEAMACGAPLVTTEGTAMAEVTGDAALLVPPGDEAALADALEALVDGDADAERRRRHGLELAARYTWEASAAGHVGVYRSVT